MKQLPGGDRPSGLYELVVLKFVRNRVAVAGGICLILIVLAVVFAPQVTPYDPIGKIRRNAI